MDKLKMVNVRLVEDRTLYSSIAIRNPSDAVEIMRNELSQYDREVMCILNLDSKHRVINVNIASIGSINAALIEPREIFKASILSNADSLFLMHNHPSGDVSPSHADLQVTKRLVQCGELLGIKVLDHVIIGGGNNEYYSFVREGKFPVAKSDFLDETISQNSRKPRKIYL